ncbi:MAG: hypothetical protein CVV12_00100 [Gammaproteobacteria bacterium HGW-Gammaproteobacteria-2]|jgi:hypothetical protein|nr:MAG: hypothetical protein CVV12_00100 [Gammaproteobacteria bacterium HGW-Gammaproteobacteria-2]
MTSQARLLLFQSMALCIGAALSFPAFSADNSALMGLLKVLRDKGTLSDSEYQSLVQAADGDSAKAEENTQAVAAVSDKVDSNAKTAAAVSDKVDAMAWASKIKLSGDMRNRFEYNSTDDKHDRSRARLRYRLGITANPVEHVEVGAGIASGGADPRSSNQTFNDAFSSKSINLDYAYSQFSGQLGAGNIKAIAGKFKFGDYLWMTDNLLWDTDIRPEGVSLDYAVDNDLGRLFVNGGAWVLGESSQDSNDPYMVYAQLGQKLGSDKLFATVAGTYYNFNKIVPGTSGGLKGGNIGTFSAGTNTDSRFDAIAFDAELGSKHLFGGEWAGSVFGNFIKNTDTNSSKDTGFSLGANLGKGPLSFKYIYANLDANGFPDIFPDADRFAGATDIRSHGGSVAYDVYKNISLSLNYTHSERKSTGINEDLLQTDISVKF